MESAPALETDVVIRNIFKFLSFNDLKNVRRVNHQWNSIAVPKLQKRSAPIHLDHDLRNFKKFYKLELVSKNQDIAAKVPMSVHIRSGENNDWKILKDLVTHESWKTRVTTIMLSDFWAADMNRLLPFLLNNLPNLTVVNLSCLNNGHRVCQSVMPRDVPVPPGPMNRKYRVKTLRVLWYGHVCSEKSLVLDPQFLAQCTYLKELLLDINGSAYEVIEFFKLFNKMNPDTLASVDHMMVSVKLLEGDETNNETLVAAIAQFINCVKPTSLDLTRGENFDPLALFPMLKTEIHSLMMDVPYISRSHFATNWLLSEIRTFSVLSKLKEVHLRPSFWVIMEEEPALPSTTDLRHHFEQVTNLKISFDLKSSIEDAKYKDVLEQASAHLLNVQQVDFCSMYLHKIYGTFRMNKLTDIFRSLRNFPKMQKLSFELEDWSGDLVERGQKVSYRLGNWGIFKDLELLKGSALQEFSISAKLDYDLSVDSAFVVFFFGYHEPNVNFNFDWRLKTQGRTKLQLSSKEFNEALKNAQADFNVKTPGSCDLLIGSPRYLKLRNYTPSVKTFFF